MNKVQFGWLLPLRTQNNDAETFLADADRALALIKGQYNAVWVADHLMFDDNAVLDGWTLLTLMAARHPEFHFGHTVLCQSFRNPALVAKMAATLQYLTGGRFILGIGAGWHESEYRAYGYDFPMGGIRVEQLDEALTIIKALWMEKQATFQGQYYRIEGAYCEPKPDPLPPILLPAFKPKAMRVAARHADCWDTGWVNITEYRSQVAEMERACAEVGRDPATLQRSWFGGCACAPTEAGATAIAGERYDRDTAFVGTPAQVIEQMAPFVEAGVTQFELGFDNFPDLTTLELLVHEVLPALNK